MKVLRWDFTFRRGGGSGAAGRELVFPGLCGHAVILDLWICWDLVSAFECLLNFDGGCSSVPLMGGLDVLLDMWLLGSGLR